MSTTKNNKYKFITVVLSVFLLIILFKSYKDNKLASEQQNSLKQENILAQNQLSEILNKYDSLTAIYNNTDETFSSVNKPTETKLFNTTNLNVKISEIKDSIAIFKNKLKKLETLQTENKPKETNVTLVENKVKESAFFDITNLQVKGVKFLNENTASRKPTAIEQIRVCFTIDKNTKINSGEKEFYIQVVNPKNEIVSVGNLSFENNNTVLKYSKLAKFTYNQKITDVCSYVDLEKNKTIKGKYIVNLYSGLSKISSTIFNYN